MALDTSFPGILSLFGGSIFRDEYRGNFAEARRQIEAKQSQLQENLDELASVQLARAILGIVSGDVNDAEEILSYMSSKNSMFSSTWQIRAEIYRKLIFQKGSLLRAFDGCLDLGEFQTVLWNCLEAIGPTKQLEPKSAWTTELVDEQKWIFINIIAVFIRTMSIKIPNNSPFHPKAGSKIQQGLVANMSSQLANYQQSGCPAGYGLRIQAESSRIQDSSDYWHHLANARRNYRDQRQQAGEASCIMMEGDFYCSHQYSNITALNMGIYESTSHDGSEKRWDEIEDNFQIGNTDKALQLYETAQTLFATCNAPRGVAATHLRIACLTMFQTVITSRETLNRDSQLAVVRESLQIAMSGFEFAGDYLSAKLVKTHYIIFDIFGSNVSRAAAAAEIGIWGKQHRNFQFAHDLGLLLLRLGSHQWRNKRAFDHSVLFLEAAQALFAGLGAHGSELQAETARAAILSDSMDHVAARILFLSATQKLEKLVKTLQPRAPLQMWEPRLRIFKTYLNNAMVELFYYLRDLPTIERILQDVQRSQGSSDAERESISNVPRLIFYRAKLQYQKNIQKDDMTEGLKCLDMGLESLLALDANRFGEHRDTARFNILIEMMRYEEARSVMRETSGDVNEAQKIENRAFASNAAEKKRWTSNFYKTQLQFAMNCLDFALAETYVRKLEKLQDEEYFNKDSNGIVVSRKALYLLGPLYEGLGDLEGAIIRVNIHLGILETTRLSISDAAIQAETFGHNEIVEVFDTAVRICVRLHERKVSKMPPKLSCNPPLKGKTWAEQALIFAEKGKARTMLDSVRNSLSNISQDENSAQRQIFSNRRRKLMEQMAKSARVISRLNNQIEQANEEEKESAKQKCAVEQTYLASLETEFSEIETLLSKERSLQRLQDAETYSQNLDSLDIIKHLPSKTVVLEYTTAYNGIAVFAINSSRIISCHWIEIKKLDLQQRILDFIYLMKLERMGVPDRTNKYSNSVRYLSTILINPVSSVLAETENIIFIPSGPLFNFPLGMLEVSSQPLMLSHNISQVPSLSIWYELCKSDLSSERRSEGKTSVTVFCNSENMEGEFNLQFIRAQAFAIAQMSGKIPIVTDQISSARFREAGHGSDILHYCSHGGLDREAPLLANLQLFPEDSTENISIFDLQNMVNPAKLIVFSACFSGFGKILGSNDGYGFPHALLSMGVKAFVGSLWQANDNASLIFMYIFYREMLSNKPSNQPVTIAQAFAFAQRQLKNMSQDSYNTCIDEIILELRKYDYDFLEHVINIRTQIRILKLSKKNFDATRFADPLFWAPFILTGNGNQVLTSCP